MKIVNKIHKNFQYTKPYETGAPILMRFVVVLNQVNLLEHALDELQDERNTQKHYILSDQKLVKSQDRKQELEMIDKIYWAIQNDSVIPYYQGIYNNEKKCIDKYEALMRIKDLDGVIYSPNSFMNIAKKYHIYSKLSEIMIEKVILETDDKDIEVSINLSAFDINSNDFRAFLYNLLSQRKSKKILVFEILEDVLFNDVEILKQFIHEVEEYSVKIAIDDFGSGCSNLLELAQISPHYIKVDGGIILAINECVNSKTILETIMYLSKEINAQVVAECVENRDIQNYIEKMNIEYSQGFYFAKPLPINKLNI